MTNHSEISYSWKSPSAAEPYPCGVSLHSHTSVSQESLIFIHQMGMALPGVSRLYRYYSRVSREKFGIELDFESAHWRPPLQPRMAYELESNQIGKLGLYPMVSITDHDEIDAPMLLRTMPSSRHIPVSVEWSAPFGTTCFHLGIHNLPSADGPHWMRRFKQFTAASGDAALREILAELHSTPQVLTVFNHPLWDLYSIGAAAHRAEMMRFLGECGPHIHALELNGLRHAAENREVRQLAEETGHLVISGGDRHGMEPNANINLTHAHTFTGFVAEVREERRSHVHFMPQYTEAWKQRILRSTLDAITDFPEFTPGWQRWDERCFHQDRDGNMRPMSELWARNRPPRALQAGIAIVRATRNGRIARSLGMIFPGTNEIGASHEVS